MSEVVIKDLIIAAAEGAGDGVAELQEADPPLPVELEEFEIEVTYAAETEVKTKTEGQFESKFDLKFLTAETKIGHTRSTRNKATYGLKVRFLFAGL